MWTLACSMSCHLMNIHVTYTVFFFKTIQKESGASRRRLRGKGRGRGGGPRRDMAEPWPNPGRTLAELWPNQRMNFFFQFVFSIFLQNFWGLGGHRRCGELRRWPQKFRKKIEWTNSGWTLAETWPKSGQSLTRSLAPNVWTSERRFFSPPTILINAFFN